jgi:hypothetical protein
VFVSGYELPCGGALAVAGIAPGLDPETPAQAEYTVAELLALLVVHELVPETLLEPSEALVGRNL